MAEEQLYVVSADGQRLYVLAKALCIPPLLYLLGQAPQRWDFHDGKGGWVLVEEAIAWLTKEYVPDPAVGSTASQVVAALQEVLLNFQSGKLIIVDDTNPN